ncbi:MAG: hypothetical protein II098_08760 [Treponema sp.]|nr:hypothetical protein [Treponema sp.]
MNSIKLKLIFSTTAMILTAILIVSILVLQAQIREVKSNITKVSAAHMETASVTIDSFLDKPARMVKDFAYHVTNSKLQLKNYRMIFRSLLMTNRQSWHCIMPMKFQ